MTIARVSGAAFLLALSACAAPEGAVEERPLLGSITLASGPCSGICPVYSMTVTPDDRYRLEAGENTIREGKSTGALPVNSFRRAVEALDRYDITSFQRRYAPGERAEDCPDYITDLPTVDITRLEQRTRALVTFDTGCVGFADRDRLDRLHGELKQIFRVRELIAVGEPPEDEPEPVPQTGPVFAPVY